MWLDATNKTTKDLTAYPYRHFTAVGEFMDNRNPLYLYKSVCVKECPKKDETPACIGNKDSDYKCPKARIGPAIGGKNYGTTIFPGTSFCTPDEKTAKEFIGAVKKALESSEGFGTFAKYA